ncbi:MAG: ABC transporter permease [Alphaproteobacteria bacterium]|nr:ABC transporter permease [Alphaproteobacteria bacterium]
MRRVLRTLWIRLFNSALVIAVLSVVVFGFMRMIPGDPILALMGTEGITDAKLAEVKKELGLDRPLYVQYLSWAWHVLQGDFGRSIQNNEPVLPMLLERLKVTAELAVAATILGSSLGILIGVVSAVRRNTIFDSASMIGALSGVSMPVFWLGIILIVGFSVKLDIFPTGGLVSHNTRLVAVTGFPLLDSLITGQRAATVDILKHMVLPTVTLAFAPAALVARTTRASVLEVINEDYVNAGLARGLSFAGVVARHVMRNALIPVVTIIGLEIGVYLGGSIVTESVFSYPGLGRYMMQGIMANDYPVVQGAIILYAAIIVVVNLVVDLSYSAIDPRVRS